MTSKILLKGAFIALCLLALLVLPAAAAPVQTQANTTAVSQGLKDDLWANHEQYRLQEFDLNVQRATSVIAILNNYGIDTTACQSTLSSISNERSALETALSSKDRSGLATINADLKTLWQHFRSETKAAIRGHYGNGISPQTSTTDGGQT